MGERGAWNEGFVARSFPAPTDECQDEKPESKGGACKLQDRAWPTHRFQALAFRDDPDSGTRQLLAICAFELWEMSSMCSFLITLALSQSGEAGLIHQYPAKRSQRGEKDGE